MNISELIEKNKKQLLPELSEWVETFNPEIMLYNSNIMDEIEEEELYNDYKYMEDLYERFENNQCSDKDYENLYFHIEQINYNEVIIQL